MSVFRSMRLSAASRRSGGGRRSIAWGVTTFLIAAFCAVMTLTAGTPVATADPTSPVQTVSQDALPTVQINGIVRGQVTVGNTVYVVGSFTSARPAGSPAGQNETPRSNILAYDITTGLLNTSFVHTLNAPGYSVAASPDGSTIYVAGLFTQVDGQARSRVAAFATANGALLPYAPRPNTTVQTVAVTSSTVYLGGTFTSVNGNARTRLAATTLEGSLLPWAPAATGTVRGLAVAPDASKIFVGGSFSTFNGSPTYGIAAADPVTGASVSIPASSQILASSGDSDGAGIYSLRASGGQILVTGYGVSAGQFEGTAALDSAGNVTWLNDCFGDSYNAVQIGSAVYVASHAHDCSAPGYFPDTTPSAHHFALAWGTTPTAAYNVRDARGWDYSAFHPSQLLQWNPNFASGSITGQSVWSFTGTNNYVSAGGEFPTVNGTAQQGLVRFAVHALAPNKFGPTGVGAATATQQGQTSAVSVSATTAYDPDDGTLTYQLIRDGNTSSPVASVTLPTVGFWQQANRPTATLLDTATTAGVHTYRVRAVDPGGASSLGAATSVLVTGANYALGQSATQSSTLYGADASRAVDGNVDGVFNDGSVTHTGNDPYSWWQVDLGQSRSLSAIRIFNRTDCCSDRLQDYFVFVSSSPFDTSLSPVQQAAKSGVWSNHQTTQASSPTTITTPTTGRYVMVQENVANQNLSLAEVQTLGSDLQIPNAALGRPATQSSTAFDGAASRAVDGNTDGVFNDGSVTHTGMDPYSWWQVDLGGTKTLSSINIYNRTDCCTDRLSDYWVFVSATPFDTTKSPGQQASVPGVWSNHQTTVAGTPTVLGANTTGRYVMVQLNTPNQNLSLAEVQVYAR